MVKNNYKGLSKFEKVYGRLQNNEYFEFKEDNQLALIYVDAKVKGNYKRITYDVNNPQLTICKNMICLKKISDNMKKPFSKLTQEDFDNFQMLLNNDKIYTKPHLDNIEAEPQPVSHRFKQDMIVNIKQFWRFYMLYQKEEHNTHIDNYAEYLKVRKPKDSNKMIKFLTKDELDLMIESTSSYQMKTFLKVFFETGARVAEILNVKFQNFQYDEKTKIWVCRLPQEKGKSYTKRPVELVISSKEITTWLKRNNFTSEEYVFTYSYSYIYKQINILSQRVLNRHVSPKEFRKGMAMYLINSGASSDYVRAHMGWSPNSEAIKAYINQTKIVRPNVLNEKVNKDFYSDIVSENELLKTQQKHQLDSINQMQEKFEEMKKQQMEMTQQMMKFKYEKELVQSLIESKKN